MKALRVQAILTERGILNYADSNNPDYTVHFDLKGRAFYFDMHPLDRLESPWDLVEIGPSTVLGVVDTEQELIKLLETI